MLNRSFGRISALVIAFAIAAVALPVRAGDGLTLSPTLNAKLDRLYLTAYDETIQRHALVQRDGTTYVLTRAKKDRLPSMLTAGVYSSTLHYLKAVQAAGTDEPKAVMAKMRELPVNDVMTKNGKLREDGRLVRDMYLFEVKSPAESKGKDDIYKLLATVPGDEAFRPLKDGKCPFVKG